MKNQLTCLVVVITALSLMGCCFFYPDYPDCANPPNPSSFTVKFYNKRNQVCTPDIARQWYVQYTDFDGGVGQGLGGAVPKGDQATIHVDDAADSDGDGYLDYVTVRLYVGCHEDQGSDPFGWTEYSSSNNLPVDMLLELTLEADGHLTDKITRNGGGGRLEESLSTINKLTGTKIAPVKPAKKKSCCW